MRSGKTGQLAGKVAVVTGSTSGTDRAVARRFVAAATFAQVADRVGRLDVLVTRPPGQKLDTIHVRSS